MTLPQNPDSPEPSSDEPSLREVLSDLRAHLLWQQTEGGRLVMVDHAARKAKATAGATAVPGLPSPGRPAPRPPPTPLAGDRAAVPAASAAPSAELAALGENPTLDEIRRVMGDCRRCRLCEGRKTIVYGSGNPRARLVFVGEGPGADEDQQGQPFVGEAGKLLTKMIEAMGFTRDQVYICNVVKCRPPNNRNPESDEVAACEPFLQAQLKAIRPEVIVALGKFAAQTLLRDDTAISRMRGHWREYQGIPLMPTFHPAYLLRSPNEKKTVWADLQQVMARFGKK
ncbi:MAG: uracil-DNA glycosylase [Myxococcota bacterium]|nr:uracil-DNA glycosylase [Myxococcota bacterium]